MRLTEGILRNLKESSDEELLNQLIKAIDDGDMKTAYTIWYNVSDYPEDLDELQKYEHFKRMTDFYSAIPDEQVAKLERYMKGVEMDAYGDTNISKEDTVMYKPLGKKLSFEELKDLKRQDLRNNKVGWVGTDTSKFSDEEIEREANNLAREDWFTYKRMNESFDMDLLNYMLDNDIIIGAEYDHPEEYDDKHWKILYGEALDKAKEDNNSEMLNKLEKVLKENHTIVEREFITDRVTEYVITFNDGELYDEYGGEFITEDKEEADEMFNEIRQRGDIDQVSQYYKKDWVKLDTYDDYVEDDVDVYYTQGDNLEYLNIGSDLNEAKEIEEFPCEGGGTCIRAKDIPEARKYWKIMQDIGMDPENISFTKGVTEEDIRKEIISEIEWYMDMVHPPADWETLSKNYDLLVGSHEPTPNEAIHKYADKVASELRSKKGSKIKESVLTEEVDIDVTSPLELNTGVLPILNTNTYGMEDYIWDFYDTPNDDGSYIPEDEQPTFDDLKEVMKTYAQPVLEERIKKVLPSAKVTTTGVWSPQYYNFEGDQVEFTVSFDVAEFNDLMNKALADPNFESYLKDRYKSYDGFISYMADNLDEFNSQDGWKKFVQVIMFYAEDYDSEDDIFDFWEKVRENF